LIHVTQPLKVYIAGMNSHQSATASPDFYLSSTDTYGLETPRRVRGIKRIAIGHRDDALLAEIDPPIAAWTSKESNTRIVILATRHTGSSLFPVSKLPLSVHVAKPLVENVESREHLELTEVETIAWADLYETEQDALRK
jgi:hypothetical protein